MSVDPMLFKALQTLLSKQWSILVLEYQTIALTSTELLLEITVLSELKHYNYWWYSLVQLFTSYLFMLKVKLACFDATLIRIVVCDACIDVLLRLMKLQLALMQL